MNKEFKRMQKLAGVLNERPESDSRVETFNWALYEHDGRGGKDLIDDGIVEGVNVREAVKNWMTQQGEDYGASFAEPSAWGDTEDYEGDDERYLDDYLKQEDGKWEIYFDLDGEIGILELSK